MRNYEVTFIVDPVLSGDEIKTAANTYVEHLKGEGCEIVHIDEMGLRELAYSINKRNSGVYYCIEFQSETGELLPKLELALRRDERIMRFLTVKLDKYGVKYNADKRAGLIGTVKPKRKKSDDQDKKDRDRKGGKKKDAPKKDAPKKDAPKKEAPAKKQAVKEEEE